MEKFTNKLNKKLIEQQYKDVTFESILNDVINSSLTLDINEDESFSIGGIESLVDKIVVMMKVSGAQMDLDINEKVNLYHNVNNSNIKAKDIIRLYETYSADGFTKLVDSKLSKVTDIKILEGTLAYLKNETETEKVSLYKSSILNRINYLKNN